MKLEKLYVKKKKIEAIEKRKKKKDREDDIIHMTQ